MSDTKPEFTVVYQTGGTENAQWHKTALRGTFSDMKQEQLKLVRMGYNAYVEVAARVDSIGVPEGYAPISPYLLKEARL